MEYLKAKFRQLSMPVDEKIWHRYVLKIVGKKEYLFHRKFPLYLYDCAVRASRLKVSKSYIF